MKETIFILFVILVLLGLTALRYRKQIAGMIGLAQMLKETTKAMSQGAGKIRGDSGKSIPLVNCSRCSVWVPQNKARRIGEVFYCSDECVKKAAVS